eukprot:5378736-Ditylum_brightwellii.AAC.1
MTPPTEEEGSRQLRRDVDTLEAFAQHMVPSLCLICSSEICRTVYNFGDTSGEGFGFSFTNQQSIRYRVNVWRKEMRNKSSNFRELRNCVDAVKEEGEAGNLQGVEMFMYTDNSTAKSVFNRGNRWGFTGKSK